MSSITITEAIIILPGKRIPADGAVSKGHSFVDQASIAGEPLPVENVVGSNVFAGTINNHGVIAVCVERIGRDTTFGIIIAIVAALIHVGSELAFILNSARLFRHRPPRSHSASQ